MDNDNENVASFLKIKLLKDGGGEGRGTEGYMEKWGDARGDLWNDMFG